MIKGRTRAFTIFKEFFKSCMETPWGRSVGLEGKVGRFGIRIFKLVLAFLTFVIHNFP